MSLTNFLLFSFSFTISMSLDLGASSANFESNVAESAFFCFKISFLFFFF